MNWFSQQMKKYRNNIQNKREKIFSLLLFGKHLAIGFLFVINASFSYAKKGTPQADSLKEPALSFISSYNHRNIIRNLDEASLFLRSLPQLKNYRLTFQDSTISLTANHYRYNILFNGNPVYQCHLKLNINKADNTILSYFYQLPENETILNSDPNTEMETIWFPTKQGIIPAKQITIHRNDQNYELIMDLNGQELYHHDLNTYYTDSLAAIAVFLPDPLTTAGVYYEDPFLDNNDSDNLDINNQRVFLDFPVAFEGGIFFLENEFLKIVNYSNPNISPAISTTPEFIFTRNESGFEDINTFYHITVYQQYLQSLGFSLNGSQLQIDTHGNNDADNSFFSVSNSIPRITFGEGGVDDAEDADVVLHEYGHAISHFAAPGTNSGTERKAIDEALGDYIAASYSKSINEFRADDVFTWDGHNEFWGGRSTSNNFIYPDDKTGNFYNDAQILSSAWMNIHNDIGRENFDRLLFESIYNYEAGIGLKDAARLLFQVDSLMNNSLFRSEICARLGEKGLYECLDSTQFDSVARISNRLFFRNSLDFAYGGNAQITYHGSETIKVNMFDASGKLVFTETSSNGQPTIIYLSSANVNAGVYLVRVVVENGLPVTYKIAKF